MVTFVKWAAPLVVFAAAGCSSLAPSWTDFLPKPSSASKDEKKPAAKEKQRAETKVSGWVENGELALAVQDERPLGAPPKKYDKGPLGMPVLLEGITPERLVDEYAKLDEKYNLTGWLLPEELAAGVKKLLPKPPSTLPVGVERSGHPGVVRISDGQRSAQVATDDTGHAHVALSAIAITTLERGEETAKVSLDVADGGHGEVVLGRNDLIAIAERSPLPDYGLTELAPGKAFWSVVEARALSKLLKVEASDRAAVHLDEASARLLVDGYGEATLPDGARVDWSKRTRVEGLPPVARIELSLERGEHDELLFTVRLTNVGEGSFHQLRARTSSNVVPAQDLVLLFGRLGPGETIERRVQVPAPASLRGHDVTLALDFWAPDGQAPPPAEGRFRASWR